MVAFGGSFASLLTIHAGYPSEFLMDRPFAPKSTEWMDDAAATVASVAPGSRIAVKNAAPFLMRDRMLLQCSTHHLRKAEALLTVSGANDDETIRNRIIFVRSVRAGR